MTETQRRISMTTDYTTDLDGAQRLRAWLLTMHEGDEFTLRDATRSGVLKCSHGTKTTEVTPVIELMIELGWVIDDHFGQWAAGGRGRPSMPLRLNADDLDCDATEVVYVFRDSAGACLYVGRTANYERRLGEHKRLRGWWPLVVGVSAESVSALWAPRLERDLIRELHPLHNVEHCRPAA